MKFLRSTPFPRIRNLSSKRSENIFPMEKTTKFFPPEFSNSPKKGVYSGETFVKFAEKKAKSGIPHRLEKSGKQILINKFFSPPPPPPTYKKVSFETRWSRLHTFCISRVFFAKHTTKYETLAIHFRISCEFRVLLMPRKNKPRNPLTFRVNADPGAKCCKMRKAKKGAWNVKKWGTKREKNGAKYPAIHFLISHILR